VKSTSVPLLHWHLCQAGTSASPMPRRSRPAASSEPMPAQDPHPNSSARTASEPDELLVTGHPLAPTEPEAEAVETSGLGESSWAFTTIARARNSPDPY